MGPRVGLYIVAKKKKTFLIVESDTGCVDNSHSLD